MVKEQTKKRSPIGFILISLLLAFAAFVFYVVNTPSVKSKIDTYRCYWDGSLITRTQTTRTDLQPITIVQGQDPLSVGRLLQEKNVIQNANDFLCYVHKINAGDKIQAGYYEIQLPISIEQLVPYLQSSRIPTARITIPEGLRYDEIADRIDNSLGKENTIKQFNKDEFIALATSAETLAELPYLKGKPSAEGFLFPDTYEVAKNATSKEVFELLTGTFRRKVIEGTELTATKELTPYQVITLASIIEKEAGKSYDEKRTVAGILLKRMKNDWLLQVDATFLYEKKDWKAVIYQQDKLSNSAYNTYKKMGLPPTPISNPGLDSINAVLDPIESKYWYYLHGTDGAIRYAQTNEEHIRNIDLYLR